MDFLKCRDIRWKGPEMRKKDPTSVYVVRFHATAECNRRTCAVSHFGKKLLPAVADGHWGVNGDIVFGVVNPSVSEGFPIDE